MRNLKRAFLSEFTARKLFGLLFLLLIVFTKNCIAQPVNENIIAEVGEDGFTISFAELKKHHSDNFYEQRFPNSELRGFDVALNDLVTNRVKALDFFALGLHNDNELTTPIQRIISEELVYHYYKEQYLRSYINSLTIREYYDATGKEIEYRQIVIKKPENSDKLKQTEKRVDEIATLDQLNQHFEEMVRKHSEHSASAARGGLARPVSWQNSTTHPIFNQLYLLEEGDIKVLQTADAFHIIKIETINRVEKESFDEIEPQIRKEMGKIYGHRSVQEFDQEKNAVLKKDEMGWKEENLRTVISWAKEKSFDRMEYVEMLEEKLSKGHNFTLLNYANNEIDTKEYFRLVQNVLFPESPGLMEIKNLKNFIEEAIKTDSIVKKARKLGYENSIMNPDSPSAVLRSQFVRLYNKRMMEDKIPEPTPEALQQFYEKHKETLFYQLAKVNVFVKLFDSRESGEEMLSKINKGESFEEAANNRFKVKTYIKDREGQIQVHLSKDDLPIIGKHAFSLDKEEVSELIELSNTGLGTQYAIIKCVNKLMGKQLEFSEVPDLEQQFNNYQKEHIRKKIETGLKEKYTYKIYDTLLEKKVSHH